MTPDPIETTPDDEAPDLSNEQKGRGNAQRPSDELDKDRPNEETIPRKSSFL